jgi:hypothetical protein
MDELDPPVDPRYVEVQADIRRMYQQQLDDLNALNLQASLQ